MFVPESKRFLVILFLLSYHANGQSVISVKNYARLEQDIMENIRGPILQLIKVYLQRAQEEIKEVCSQTVKESYDILSERIQTLNISTSETQQSQKEHLQRQSKLISTVNLTLTSHIEKSMKCVPGWRNYSNTCYITENIPATFDEAMAGCAAYGAVIALPSNADENEFIAELTGGQESWIGARYDIPRGYFADIHYRRITYSNWYPGEPKSQKECAQINYKIRGSWDDVICYSRKIYTCQKSL